MEGVGPCKLKLSSVVDTCAGLESRNQDYQIVIYLIYIYIHFIFMHAASKTPTKVKKNTGQTDEGGSRNRKQGISVSYPYS